MYTYRPLCRLRYATIHVSYDEGRRRRWGTRRGICNRRHEWKHRARRPVPLRQHWRWAIPKPRRLTAHSSQVSSTTHRKCLRKSTINSMRLPPNGDGRESRHAWILKSTWKGMDANEQYYRHLDTLMRSVFRPGLNCVAWKRRSGLLRAHADTIVHWRNFGTDR